MTDSGSLPDFTDKAVLVTGIDSPIGYAIAEALVRSGARVHCVSGHHDQCREKIKNLRRSGKASGHVADLRNGTAAIQLAHQINEELPQLHLVVSTDRIAENSAPTDLLRGIGQGGVEILGEMAFVHELLPTLRAAGTAAAPARVVLVGNLSQSTIHQKLGTQAKEVATHPSEQRVSLDFIDVSLVDVRAESVASFFVLSALNELLSTGSSVRQRDVEGPFH